MPLREFGLRTGTLSFYAGRNLEAKRKPDICGDRRGVVGRRVEKSPRHKACKIEREDDVSYGSPPNLEIALIAEIAGMAGAGWINQRVTSKSIYPVVG